MRLISFQRADASHGFGIVTGDPAGTGGAGGNGGAAEAGLIDVSARLSGVLRETGDLRLLLERGSLAVLDEHAHRSPDLALADLRFDLPIRRPDKILCIGVNYAERNEEYKDGSAAPAYPSVFPRFPRSFTGHGQPLIRPPESAQLDYEGEIAIVIGKGGRRIPEAQAAAHIAGLTCLNEGTIRDWVRHGKFNVTQGKNWDASGSIGPWLVTADAFPDLTRLTVTTRVNGEVRQHDTTERLMFPFTRLIQYVSTWTTLVPGDIISTGTPTGAGARFDPPRFLAPGDVVEVEVPGIGVLRNSIADERG